jgi:Arc/MetJ-type ribon-helix-helix transcriptional regulator
MINYPAPIHCTASPNLVPPKGESGGLRSQEHALLYLHLRSSSKKRESSEAALHLVDTPNRKQYIGGMKTKTFITLSEDVIKAIDKRSGQPKNRSEFIETAVRAYIAQMVRRERNARDLEIINRHADRLNKEALDVLAYQGEW